MESSDPSPVLRRRFLGGSVALAGVALGTVGSRTAGAAPVGLSPQEIAMVLAVARVGAVYPVPFPAFGERGPASSRATEARLRARLSGVHPARLAQVREGARALIGADLARARQAPLLDGLGAQAAGARPPQELVAVVALAVATVSRRFDPNNDAAARVWLDGLRRRHARRRR
ncbi:hypothetical protein [Spirillospora sp. CA-294931]|uniref:hypothetical protein n=1 Tax=Spirillospora sp. CA-294931 TaxID=3240042 RepID=UPI003D921881